MKFSFRPVCLILRFSFLFLANSCVYSFLLLIDFSPCFCCHLDDSFSYLLQSPVHICLPLCIPLSFLKILLLCSLTVMTKDNNRWHTLSLSSSLCVSGRAGPQRHHARRGSFRLRAGNASHGASRQGPHAGSGAHWTRGHYVF